MKPEDCASLKCFCLVTARLVQNSKFRHRLKSPALENRGFCKHVFLKYYFRKHTHRRPEILSHNLPLHFEFLMKPEALEVQNELGNFTAIMPWSVTTATVMAYCTSDSQFLTYTQACVMYHAAYFLSFQVCFFRAGLLLTGKWSCSRCIPKETSCTGRFVLFYIQLPVYFKVDGVLAIFFSFLPNLN